MGLVMNELQKLHELLEKRNLKCTLTVKFGDQVIN